MNSEPSVPKCPQCGAAIPADAPQGLCPRCVLLGAATPTDAGKPVPRTEPPSPEALRAAFPHLDIVELIGRGGMGFVYKARQAKLDRLVALKLLPLEMGADPHFAERFHREARALARLNHPGIVAVYDFGVSAGFGYLIMEFVDGVNLRQAMQAGRFTQREALALVPKICEAIQFAHEQGVLHRDIKPENILLDTQGRVKIADFGIAKLVGEDAPDLTLTLSGARLGTPSYMAPEQVEHPGTVDHRADIYSLGVVFYELLTGELPLGRFAPPSAKADLDARVDDIVMRALAKERELRQQSAGEVKTEVETVAKGPVPGASLEATSGRVISTRSASPRRFTALKIAGWAFVWLLITFLAPSVVSMSRRTVGTPGEAMVVGRLFYFGLWGLAGLWTLVGCWVFRAEQRLGQSVLSWPRWSRWVAGLLLAFMLMSVGRSLATLWSNEGRELAVLLVPGDVGILATSLAILLRRHDLRLVATAGLAVHGLLAVVGFVGWLNWRSPDGSVSPPPIEATAGLPIGWMFTGTALLVSLGFVTLWQRELAGVDLRTALRRRLKPIGATALVLIVMAAGFLTMRRPRSQGAFNHGSLTNTNPGPVEPGHVLSAQLTLALAPNQQGRLTVVRWQEGQPVEAAPAAGLTNLNAGAEATRIPLRWDLFRLPSSDREASGGIARGELVGPTVEGAHGGATVGGRFNWAETNRVFAYLQPAHVTDEVQGDRPARRWLFWSPEDAATITRSGQMPEQIQSGFSVEYEPLVAGNDVDARSALELSVVLRDRLAEVRRLFEAGGATALEVASAERDYGVTFALARGDFLNAARANHNFAQLVLKDGRKRFEAGKLTSLELRGLEATNRMVELQLAEARKGATNRISAPAVQIASLRLELAKRALEELKNRVEVGAVTAAGAKTAAAEQAVGDSERLAKQERIAAAKAQLAELESKYSETNALHRAGRVRSTDFEIAKMRFKQAQKEHQNLLRQLDDSPVGQEWRNAWDRFRDVDEQARAGRASPLQWAFANMEEEVAAARYEKDPLKEAYAVENYRREVLRVYRDELGKGQRGRAEVDSAELMLMDAEMARQTLEQTRKLAIPSP